MGLKDALGLGDEEPPLEMPDTSHAQGDHEEPPPAGQENDPGARMPLQQLPPD